MNRWVASTAAALTLAGAAAVGYSVNALWIDDGGAGVAQGELAAEFEADLTTSTLPAAFTQDDPTITTLTPPAGQTTTSTLPALISEDPPNPGEPLGRLLIPAIGADWIIIEGVSPPDLAQGPGHMPGTALPGQPGNAVISGHRTTHGAPFYHLDTLGPGDTITIQTRIGTHTYQVVQTLTVLPADVWVTNQVPGAWLTLTTCHPRYSAQQRLIVFAQLTAGPNWQTITTTQTGNQTPPQPPT